MSIHGAGQGRREIKIDDDGAWPSWSQSGALFYNQADGTHSRLVRVEIDDRGRVTKRQVVAATRELFGGFAEVNEAAIAPDESWFVARTRGNAAQNGVGAFTVNPPGSLPLARAGDIGCIPRMAPSGRFALIAGATPGHPLGPRPAGARAQGGSAADPAAVARSTRPTTRASPPTSAGCWPRRAPTPTTTAAATTFTSTRSIPPP